MRLPGQPFCILSILLKKPGEVVTREEIQRQLWPSDTFVDFEHSLNTAIKKLRTALGDSPENSRYIETLPRVGYRFVAPLEEVAAEIQSPSQETVRAEQSATSKTVNAGFERRWQVAIALLACFI